MSRPQVGDLVRMDISWGANNPDYVKGSVHVVKDDDWEKYYQTPHYVLAPDVNVTGYWIQPADFTVIRRAPALKDSGKREGFAGGGMREPETGKPRFDLLVPENVPYQEQFLTRFAVHMAKGAEKYEARNWEQFSDDEALERAKSGAFRHFMQWLTGETDEDHAAALVFNLMVVEHINGKKEKDQ